jgi:hypothetical protein
MNLEFNCKTLEKNSLYRTITKFLLGFSTLFLLSSLGEENDQEK